MSVKDLQDQQAEFDAQLQKLDGEHPAPGREMTFAEMFELAEKAARDRVLEILPESPELNEAQTAEVRETAINFLMQALTSVPNPPNFAELRTLYARAMLQACDGNKTHAALKLCIDRRTLYRLLGHS